MERERYLQLDPTIENRPDILPKHIGRVPILLGSTTNTFQLPCRMLTPTLFDMEAITSLHPTGGNFNPNESDKDIIDFYNNRINFSRYIKDYHVTGTTEVTAKEHIAFLALWLS